MNRERKYRAWDGEDMHYNVMPWQWDFVVSKQWHRCEKSSGIGLFGSGGKTGEFLVPGIRFKELMDWSGLKDKNDKDIYEGDIVKLVNADMNEILVVCEYGIARREVVGAFYPVEVDIPCFYFKVPNGHKTFPIVNNYAGKHDLEMFEVLGNIYQNSELVNG